jgi:peptidyl-prolyl cis-trans isomerase C
MTTSLQRLAAGVALSLLAGTALLAATAAVAQDTSTTSGATTQGGTAQTGTTQGGTTQGGTTQGGTAQGTTTQGGTTTTQGGAAAQPAAADADPVVAIVNGKTLRRSDVIASAQSLPPQYRNQIDAYFPALTDRLIDMTLMTDEGRKEKLQDDPEVKKIMAAYEDQAIREVLLHRQLAGKVTDADLKKKYDEMVKAMKPQEEVRASHILVPTEDEAKAIIKELEAGDDFAKLAKEKSKDPGASNGGDLGYFSDGDMVPEFWAAASKLNKGEYTKTPVKTQFGWHVILVTDKRTKPAPTFDQVKDQLEQEATQQVIAAYLAGLHKDAKVQKFGPDGKPLPDQPAAQ